MDKTKQLEQYINKATNEGISQPDPQGFIEICNIINSRGDMPKIAIGLIRKRLMTRNPKVLYLCLELLEVAANACELNFQSQVAAKDFLMILNSLVTREMDKTVLNKLTHLVKYWTQIFGHCKDILPGIFAFYDALEKKGVPMPSTVESKYAYLLKNKPSPAPSRSDNSYGGGMSGGSDYQSRPSGSTGSGSRNEGGSGSKGVSSKLKKDLEVVRQNIQLTNEMIDAQDPREDPKNNDVLTDLVQTLKGMENKMREFIAKQNDEATLSFLLELNDDLNKTFDRYKAIRRGNKPPPFIPADVQNSIDREDRSGASKPKPQQQQQQQQQKPKPSVQDDLLDLLGDTNLNQGQTSQANNTAMNKAEVQNLFDFDIASPSMPTQQPQGGFNTAQPNFGNFGGMSGGATPTQPSQTANTFGQAVQNKPAQPQFNANSLADLYKTGGQAQPQGQGQGQGQFGGGMGNMMGNFATTSGGYSQPQQGFGMNQFQTSQPGFGQAQQGGFNTQSGNMQGGMGMQSGGNMQGFGMNQGGMNQGGMSQMGQGQGQGQGMSGMGQGFGGMGQMGQGGMGQGMSGMSGYGNFNTSMGMGQGQGQGGMGGFGQAQQNQFGGGSFNTANPNAGFGGNMGGQSGFGGQPQQSNTGFNQPMGGGFSTAPQQNKGGSNPFDLSDLRDTINQKQTNTQPDPFADLL